MGFVQTVRRHRWRRFLYLKFQRRRRQFKKQGLPLELIAFFITKNTNGTESPIKAGQNLYRAAPHAPHAFGHLRLATAGDLFGIYPAQDVQLRTELFQ